ncbi:MAG: c-type cytochrome [Bacteroidota bacterium]
MMDFIHDMVIPQSADNLNLLKFILLISYSILIPYSAFITGSVIYAVVLETIGRRKEDRQMNRAAFEIADRAVLNKNVLIGLGLMPFIALFLAYTQLLANIIPSPVIVLGAALAMYAAALIQLNSYKHTFFVEKMIVRITGQGNYELFENDENKRLESYNRDNFKLHRRNGILSVILLLLSVYVLQAAAQMAMAVGYGQRDVGFLSILFSLRSLVQFFLFIDASLTLSLLGLLSLNPAQGELLKIAAESKGLLRKGLITAFLCVAGMPVWLIVNMYMAPKQSLTETFFFSTALATIGLFVVLHNLWFLLRGSGIRSSSLGFFSMLVAVLLFIGGEQSAFDNSVRRQVLVLASVYDKKVQDRNEKMGRGVAVDGKAIFDGRCSACHRFDMKLVGPAYKDVLPKYEGKMDQLTGFILNPVKVNPAFPPMPNQGVKPAEAKAVAEYIMKTYKEKTS